MFGILAVIIVIVIGCLSGKLCEGLIMIAPFMLIRKFSGGYHLNSPVVCFVLSALLISGAILVSDALVSATALFWLSCVVFAAYVSIFSLSPIDSESRRLTEKEKAVFRRISRILASVIVTVYFLLLAVGQPHYCIAIIALLQVPCIIAPGYQRSQKPLFKIWHCAPQYRALRVNARSALTSLCGFTLDFTSLKTCAKFLLLDSFG